MEKNKYDKTVSASKEESIQKAMEIFNEELFNENEIKRPEINSKQKIFRLILLTAIYVILVILAIYFLICWNKIILGIFFLITLIIVISFTIKTNIIDIVLLYQKFAPLNLRKACRFIPSCSEYMILAIEKYGVVKGFFKGIRRILRCHPPNGGEDYP